MSNHPCWDCIYGSILNHVFDIKICDYKYSETERVVPENCPNGFNKTQPQEDISHD